MSVCLKDEDGSGHFIAYARLRIVLHMRIALCGLQTSGKNGALDRRKQVDVRVTSKVLDEALCDWIQLSVLQGNNCERRR